ncbi:MAG: TolC family protein [Pseudomonadales bacterium]
MSSRISPGWRHQPTDHLLRPRRRLLGPQLLALAWLMVACGSDGVEAAAAEQTLALGLAEAVSMAREQNAELELLDAQRAEAEGAQRSSLQAFLPTLSADANYLRADSSILEAVPVPELALPPRIVVRDLGPLDAYTTGVQVLQPVINVDAWRTRDQAIHLVDARQRALLRGQHEVTAAVTSAYFGIKAIEARSDALDAAIVAAERAVLVAEQSYAEGLVASLDMYRARADAAGRRAQRAQAEGDLVQAEAGLRQLLGLDQPVRLVLIESMPEPARPPDAAAATDAAERDDIGALEKTVEAAEAGVRRARAAYLPRLNLFGRYQWVDGDEPFGGNFDGWLVAVNLRWTPFAGMAQAGELAQAEAELRQAQARLRGLRHQARQELDAAWANWRAARIAWQESETAVEASALALRRAQGRYREGVGSMTDLLAAQAADLQSQVERSNSQYLALLAEQQYRLAAGAEAAGVGRER